MASPILTPIPNDTTYTIAVRGSMNPAIHNLLWYKVIGAIDEAEYDASIKFPFNTTMQLLSQVRLIGPPNLAIQCQPNEWTIQGFGDESWSKMIEITKLVFERLNETPVGGYSMVAQKHLDTQVPDVRAVLAERIYRTNLAIPQGSSIASNIEITVG